jgi:hypothetical protein
MWTVPSPGGQVSEMAGYEHCCGWAGLGRMWHLIDLLKGYHAASRGQSQTTHALILLRAAPGMPRGRADARSTRCHSPYVQDQMLRLAATIP